MPEVIKKPDAPAKAPAKPKPEAPAKSQVPAKAKAPQREVKYPTKVSEICVGPTAITVERMKELLGWVEEEEGGEKFGADYLFLDGLGKKIRLTNNVTNRPIYPASVDALKQEHLNLRWKFNGEPIIIGEYGSILNGQHTGISLVLAEQERTHGKPEQVEHWKKNWPGPVTMEKMIVFGVKEDDGTVNTMDTCKPRSLADVIYRSEYFAKTKPADRRVISRMTDYAIRLVWHRTWVSADAFAPRRTHAEALDFLNHHPKLLKAVRHVFEEDKDGKISKYISPGYASAICYLMGASNSKLDDYLAKAPSSEKACDFSLWDKAEEFWVGLGDSNAEDFKEVRYALGALNSPDTGAGGSLTEKIAVLAKAWAIWSDKGSFKEGDLVVYEGSGEKRSIRSARIQYNIDGDGIRQLDDFPIFGGIDRGQPVKEKPVKKAPAADDTPSANGSAQDKLAASRDKLSKDQADLLARLRKENPGKVLVFKGKDDYKAWDDDAQAVAEASSTPIQLRFGMRCAVIHRTKWEELLPALREKVSGMVLVSPGSTPGAVVVSTLSEGEAKAPAAAADADVPDEQPVEADPPAPPPAPSKKPAPAAKLGMKKPAPAKAGAGKK